MRYFVGALLSGMLFVTASSTDSFAQGLAERRAVKEYQEGKFPELKKEIDAAAGYDLPIKVDWDKLALPGEAENYTQDGFWTNIYFKPLIQALSGITKDEMGKTALKEKLKEVQVTYDEATAPASNYANGVSFENGKLAINFRPWSNADDVTEREKAIRDLLESKL